MSKKLPKAEWDEVADWWDSEAGDRGIYHQRTDIDPVVLKVLGDVKNKKILEIGCGNGYFARLLSKKGAKITATDLSQKLLEHALKYEKTKPLEIKYLTRDAADLYGIKSKTFDIVVGNMCIMDIKDAKNAIKEVSRVLKKGGRFIFSITHPVFFNIGQTWVILKDKRKKYFARAVCKYLSTTTDKQILWASGIPATQYHRSVETYIDFLSTVNLLLSDFKEIPSKKDIKKATEKDGDVTLRRSRYKNANDKKMKKVAINEIPMFLVFGSVKIK
jgi:ubiquinone/menaquinone biosynthesis C-methylase UbiE